MKTKFTHTQLPKPRAEGGYIIPTKEFLLKAVKECTEAEFKTLIVLLTHVNRSTSACFPSQELLAEEVGVTRTYISNTVIPSLERKGFIVKGIHHARCIQYYILDDNYHAPIMSEYT